MIHISLLLPALFSSSYSFSFVINLVQSFTSFFCSVLQIHQVNRTQQGENVKVQFYITEHNKQLPAKEAMKPLNAWSNSQLGKLLDYTVSLTENCINLRACIGGPRLVVVLRSLTVKTLAAAAAAAHCRKWW